MRLKTTKMAIVIPRLSWDLKDQVSMTYPVKFMIMINRSSVNDKKNVLVTITASYSRDSRFESRPNI
jgi:hypothetical protein